VYLTKPFSLTLLRAHINGLLTRSNQLKTYYQSIASAYEIKEDHLVHQDQKEMMMKIIAIIDQHIDNNELGASFVAEKLNLHPQTLYRKVKSVTGMSTKDYIKEYRFLKAEKLLYATDLTVQEIMFKVGINNKSYFYREFIKRNKVTPKVYRQPERS
jgi:AraC-like DNA-binding protein